MGKPEHKVFIGPREIAGFSASLGSGFNTLGWKPFLYDETGNQLHYKCAASSCRYLRTLGIINGWLHRRAALIRGGRHIFSPITGAVNVFAFVWALYHCHSFIYIFGKSLLPLHIDLWLLKRMKRPVVQVYLGSDSRPPYLSGLWLDMISPFDEALQEKITRKEVRRKKAQLNRVYSYATYIVDNPLTGILQPGPFINWFAMGFPNAFAKTADHLSLKTVPYIVHAPSNSRIKGTALVEQTLRELKEEGCIFDFSVLSGLSNECVRKELEKATIVIDQLYSDTPLAGLASEAAAAGCAVLVGGYGWSQLTECVDTSMLPPSICFSPENLKETLRSVIEDPDACASNGQQLATFMASVWSPEKVAGRYISLLEANPSENWWIRADAAGYIGGMGAEPNQFTSLIVRLCNKYGDSALGCDSQSPVGKRLLARYNPDRHDS